jgi:hypothetical protein
MRIVLLALVLCTGCSNRIAGTVSGKSAFVAKSALFYSTPVRAISILADDAQTACANEKARLESVNGSLLIFNLTGATGTVSVATDTAARAGQASGQAVVFYYGPDTQKQTNWQGSVTITDVSTSSVSGVFDINAGADQLNGAFTATPCL